MLKSIKGKTAKAEGIFLSKNNYEHLLANSSNLSDHAQQDAFCFFAQPIVMLSQQLLWISSLNFTASAQCNSCKTTQNSTHRTQGTKFNRQK